MDWSVVPILTVMAVGFFGFCLMVAAFVLIARQGGWVQAMRSEPDGRWSVPRRLMFAGASIGIAFWLGVAILFLIAGGIPWLDVWDGGAVLAALLPGLAAVWFFSIGPRQFAARQSEQSRTRSGG
jgi:hypothetical protein